MCLTGTETGFKKLEKHFSSVTEAEDHTCPSDGSPSWVRYLDSLPAEDWGEVQMYKTTDYLNIELQHGPRVLSFVGFEFVKILFGS